MSLHLVIEASPPCRFCSHCLTRAQLESDAATLLAKWEPIVDDARDEWHEATSLVNAYYKRGRDVHADGLKRREDWAESLRLVLLKHENARDAEIHALIHDRCVMPCSQLHYTLRYSYDCNE